MKYLLLCIGVLVTLQVSGQKHPAYDSLLQVIESRFNILSEEEKEATLREMSTLYASMDSTQSMYYVTESISLAEKINYPPLKITAMEHKASLNSDLTAQEVIYNEMLALSETHQYPKGKADALYGLGNVNAGKYNVEEAVQYLQKAIDIYLHNGYDLDAADTYGLLGSIYNMQGDYVTVTQYILKALAIAERLGHRQEILNSYINLGAIQYQLKDFDGAIQYYEKAMNMAKEIGNKKSLATVLNHMGLLYRDQYKHEEAVKLLRQSITLRKVLGDESKIAYSQYFLAECYFELNALDSAKTLAEESGKVFRDKNALNGEIYTAVLLGKIYTKQKNWKDAKNYLTWAKGKSTEIGWKENAKISTKYLAMVEAALGNYKAAYENHLLHKEMSDSMLNESNLREMMKVQSEYAFEKERDSIQYANAQEKLILDQSLQRAQTIEFIAIGGVAILLAIAFILYRYYRSKQKANVLLQQKNTEIEHQRKELASLDKAKSRFFANISHELRTPLTLISGPLENLMQHRSYDHATMDMALRNTKKLKGLVNDILDLSKLESDRPEVNAEPTQPDTFIRRIFSNYESFVQDIGIGYQLEMAETLPEWVMLDKARVEKVLNNLLFNAIKYTEAAGQVLMSVSSEGEKLIMTVKDTGQGIAASDLPHIFDRYFQSKQPDAPVQGGTGIGLALARELALLMEGDLTVESELGKGSSFRFTIALVTASAPENPVQEEKESEYSTLTEHGPSNQEIAILTKPDGSQHKVLIVEDNTDMRQYITQLLSGRYQVTTAINGKKALSILEQDTFDLIITDAMMPEMDGFQLLEHMKSDKNYAGMPVIMLTALNLEKSKLQALTLGVDDYLTKPFSPTELLARVANLITRYEVRKTTVIELAAEEKSTPTAEKAQATAPTNGVVYQSDMNWLKEVETVVGRELTNTNYQITDLAEHLNLSKRQFQRKLKLLTGMTYTDYHHEMSLQKARQLLETGTYGNVTAVALSVGISNPSRFSEMYFNRFGKKPADYFREKISSL